MPRLPQSARLALVVLLLGALAACQTPSALMSQAPAPEKGNQSPLGTSAVQGSTQVGPIQSLENTREAVDLRVFLADSKARPGWTPVPLQPKGILYVRTDAIIDRSDLMGIQSATDQAGGGLLVLILTDAGLEKLRTVTAANPGLRLALVVGKMMLAAPTYAAPIHAQKLAFAVGSVHNAEVAARSVAGVP
ncbi:hypothetical protein [Castellaniella sp.]|uniref:hypothetical protein n=1 Tax=Castellaniella sp. TaxID=1955812 RepID=UPI002AFED0C1|nr:hypothetical protein [Castellaniella sp.]